MKRLLLGILIIVLLAACSNPFFPPLKDKGGEVDLTTLTTLTTPTTPSISSHPQGAVYSIDAQAAPLTTTAAKSDNGVLSYKWYSNNVDSNTGGTLISGATLTSYIPPTNELGIVYYYVVVINTLNGKIKTLTSNTARIEVNDKVNAAVPQITTHPQGATYTLNATAEALTVAATVTDGGTLSYQWYSNTVNSNTGGTTVGINYVNYAPSTAISGTVYYYVVITNTITNNGDGGNKTATATSNIAEVKLLTVEQAIIINEISANMVTVNVPVGVAFILGKDIGTSGLGDTVPVFNVSFTQGFKMSKYQVTQRQYEAVMGTNPSYFHGGAGRESAIDEIQGKRPVESIRWYETIVFCNKLSVLAGLTPAYDMQTEADASIWSSDTVTWGTVPTSSNTRWDAVRIVTGSTGYRLPTEAQWEYAAKGGTLSQSYSYSGSNDPNEVAWYNGKTGTPTASRTHQVGLLKENELGIFDMSGNVWEWCWDRWGSYTGDEKTDPVGASSGTARVMRGGNWLFTALTVRSVNRNYNNPNIRGDGIGFRLSRPAE